MACFMVRVVLPQPVTPTTQYSGFKSEFLKSLPRFSDRKPRGATPGCDFSSDRFDAVSAATPTLLFMTQWPPAVHY